MDHTGTEPGSSLEQPLHEFLGHDRQGTKQQWKLCFYSNSFTIAATDGDVVQQLTRQDLPAMVVAHENGPLKGCLQLLKPTRHLFQLSPEDFTKLQAWLGPPTHADLKVSLKRSSVWMIPIGILWITTSLPISGDALAGIEALPFDQFAFALGVCALLIGLLPLLIAHRVFFVLVIVWDVAFCADMAHNILVDGASPWWGIACMFVVSQTPRLLRQFRRFRDII